MTRSWWHETQRETKRWSYPAELDNTELSGEKQLDFIDYGVHKAPVSFNKTGDWCSGSLITKLKTW